MNSHERAFFAVLGATAILAEKVEEGKIAPRDAIMQMIEGLQYIIVRADLDAKEEGGEKSE